MTNQATVLATKPIDATHGDVPNDNKASVSHDLASSPASLLAVLAIAARATVATLLLTGLVYPLAVTALAQVIFPASAQGSLVRNEKQQVVGSALLAQRFVNPAYVQPRPSAAGDGYDATSSGGTNLGPTSKKLRDSVAERLTKIHAENPEAPAVVPDQLVTSSASGLDPHLSPAAVFWQLPRIAKARHVAQKRVQAVIDEAVEGRDFGIFGEPRVNVLLLNLALDRRFGQPAPVAPVSP